MAIPSIRSLFAVLFAVPVRKTLDLGNGDGVKAFNVNRARCSDDRGRAQHIAAARMNSLNRPFAPLACALVHIGTQRSEFRGVRAFVVNMTPAAGIGIPRLPRA